MGCEICQDNLGRWFLNRASARHYYTVLTKMPDSRRGEYAEEIDVLADTPGKAKYIARIVLKDGYDPDLRISRTVMHW